MSIYNDLSAAAEGGIKRTAADFFERAKLKFIERQINRTPKTELERNVRSAFIDTPTGRANAVDYRNAQIKKYLSNPIFWIASGVILIALMSMLRK